MKNLFKLVDLAALAVFIYEIWFLIQNGTAGNIQNIVIVMVLAVMFVVKFFVKSAINIVKLLMILAIVYAIINFAIPYIA